MREGGASEPLDIVIAAGESERPHVNPIGEWPLHGTAYPARATLYEVPGGFEYWTTDAGRFRVDLEGGRIELPHSGDEILREQRLCGMPMILAFGHRGDFSLHAAAVQVGGGAVILAGPSGFGKTTLALAFHVRGYRLLTEDLVCCRPATHELLPGPALVRLRPDVYSGAPPEGMEVIAERPDRVFLAPLKGHRGDSGPLPIKGIVFLREGMSLRMEEAGAVDAVRDLWHLGFRIPAAEERTRSFQWVTGLVRSIPAWNVIRPLRSDALGDTVNIIVKGVGG
jgi:hypothetical protein